MTRLALMRVVVLSLSWLTAIAAGLAPLLAGQPWIQFDTPLVVGCRDVTPLDFFHTNPGEKLIEARFCVSALLAPGEQETDLECLYTFESLYGTMAAADYLPKTTLQENVLGSVQVEKKAEQDTSLALTLKGAHDKLASGVATLGRSRKHGAILKYEKLPPLELVSAAGLTRRGAGVCYKLKSSPRHSLQGAKEFVVVFRVPDDWGGDYVYVRCGAWRGLKGLSAAFQEQTTVGAAEFFVALHLEGDAAAKSAAAQFVRSELALRAVAQRHQEEIQRRALPTVAHQVGALVSLVKPKIPENWLAHLLLSSPRADPRALLAHLPAQVRSAAVAYLRRRQQFLMHSAWARAFEESSLATPLSDGVSLRPAQQSSLAAANRAGSP